MILFMLTSCNKKEEITIEIDNSNTPIYVIDYNSNEIRKIYIDYPIKDYNDYFHLYTIYRNNIPRGYYINANSNVGLIDSYEKDNDIYYVVDKYIYLTKDIKLFNNILELSNKLLGYDKTFIICNNKLLDFN